MAIRPLGEPDDSPYQPTTSHRPHRVLPLPNGTPGGFLPKSPTEVYDDRATESARAQAAFRDVLREELQSLQDDLRRDLGGDFRKIVLECGLIRPSSPEPTTRASGNSRRDLPLLPGLICSSKDVAREPLPAAMDHSEDLLTPRHRYSSSDNTDDYVAAAFSVGMYPSATASVASSKGLVRQMLRVQQSQRSESKLAGKKRMTTSQPRNTMRQMLQSGGTRQMTRVASRGMRSVIFAADRPSFVRRAADSFKKKKQAVTAEGVTDMVVALAIVLNGICFGAQTEYMSTNLTEKTPMAYAYIEICFCIIFTVELAHRVWKSPRTFFSPGCAGFEWNVFDTFLVTMQLFDVACEYIMAGMGKVAFASNLSFVRLLRILRLLRVLRLVRLFQFLGDLNVVTSAIAASLKSLVGTLVMMFLMMFIVGMGVCQLTNTHRIDQRDRDPERFAELLSSGSLQDDAPLQYWWGSLLRSILTLYEAILGGVDWNDVVMPLIGVHPILGVLFAVYIAFVILTMFNVLTGVFVESSLKLADKLKTDDFVEHLSVLIEDLSDSDGQLSRQDFDECLQVEETRTLMKSLGIELDDATVLFDFICEESESGSLNAEEVLTGLVRLRAGAKFIDVVRVLHAIDDNFRQMRQIHHEVDHLTQRVLTAESPPSLGRPCTKELD
eukprot:TRINITY_DN3307_c0_g1_i1.p1 TRINITY_DN3307_c0_g1~~TRINITY_DN3307_c0_g1_i1.p1  ORF type:complete len:666 (+),score=117.52 TRINITY_DN3307_c0_g1_i1:177-2174(+)